MDPEEVDEKTEIGFIFSEQGPVKMVMDLQVNSCVAGPLSDFPG
jgi:hypothetical protein